MISKQEKSNKRFPLLSYRKRCDGQKAPQSPKPRKFKVTDFGVDPKQRITKTQLTGEENRGKVTF